MTNPKFQILKGTDSQYYYRLRSGNGEIILSGEGYTTKPSCQNGITSVKSNAPFDHKYNRLTASNGQYYFVLIAANGEIIGKSELYTTQYAMENGINAVKRDAPNSPTEDLA